MAATFPTPLLHVDAAPRAALPDLAREARGVVGAPAGDDDLPDDPGQLRALIEDRLQNRLDVRARCGPG